MSTSRPPTGGPAIWVDGVSKQFQLPHERIHTLKERALHPFKRTTHETLHALDDVGFDVQKGEFFGIVGRNGSGKSTLLKCLAGIYATDSGRIVVDGRMSMFIELGVGFNLDLAAQDNVVLNATMLGLSTREARRRYDRIIDFAELRDFQDLKLKNYSSGMMVRLAFAVMIQVDAEILLIDEVLAVGDAAFQQKCYDEFARIRRSGATVVLVTHDMSAVQRFCDRALLLEHGRRVDLGEPGAVGDHYLQLNFSKESAREEEPVEEDETPRRFGDGAAEIVDAWFENEQGARVENLPAQQMCAFCARVRFNAQLEDPLFGFDLHNGADTQIWAANNLMEPPSGIFDKGDEAVFSIRFRNLFAPDRYWATPAVARANGGVEWHDRRVRFASVVVTATRRVNGVVDLPYDIDVTHTARADDVDVAYDR